MAQVEESGSGRSAHADLNLVPFIDLMSVLITFLLITAVWTQVSMIQIGSSIYGKKSQDDVPPPPPMADIPLRLDVKETGMRLIIGSEQQTFPKANGKYETEPVITRLKDIKTKYPEKQDAVITVDDEVKYEFLILGMDTLLQGGFPSIAVATGGSN